MKLTFCSSIASQKHARVEGQNSCPLLSSFREKNTSPSLLNLQWFNNNSLLIISKIIWLLPSNRIFNTEDIKEIKKKKILTRRNIEILMRVPWHPWITKKKRKKETWSKWSCLYHSSTLPVMQDLLGSRWGEEEVIGSAFIWKHLSLGKRQMSVSSYLTSTSLS